jgi:hypothetical protein
MSSSKVSSTDIDCVGLSGTDLAIVDTTGELVEAPTIAAEVVFEYWQNPHLANLSRSGFQVSLASRL